MVPLHILNLEILTANRTNTFLSLVGFPFLVFSEGANAEIAFFPVQDL